jgi:hypothetical protein
MGYREEILSKVGKLNRPVALWGAGKGIVLGYALLSAGVQSLTVIDADPNRWNQFLDSVGIRVESPQTAISVLSTDLLVLVCNPSHLPGVKSRFGDRWECILPSQLGSNLLRLG